MDNETIIEALPYYEQKFATLIGLNGHQPGEAYLKAYGLEKLEEKDIRKAIKLSKRKDIAYWITTFREEVGSKAIKIAQNQASYEKVDAMRQLQLLMAKCEISLNVTSFKNDEIEKISKILLSEESLDVKNKQDMKLHNLVISILEKPLLDYKTAEVYTKTIRLGSELYNLVNNDTKLTLDDESKKAINILEKAINNDLESVKKLAGY